MQHIKRILDGFLFGVGFCIAVAVVVAGLLLAGVTSLMQRGSDEGGGGENHEEESNYASSEAIIVTSSNLVSRAGARFITATISNTTAETFSEVAVAANINHSDGEFADFRVHLSDVFPSFSQTNITIEFEEGSSGTLIDSPTINLEIMVAPSSAEPAKLK